MKKYITILIFGLSAVVGFAQQESQFTNFMNNYLALNPAYAGARDVPSFTALYRNQWLGFEGAPVSQVLSFNTPIFKKRIGLGASILHRTAGITSNWSAQMAYSYDLQVTEDLGIRVGMHGVLKYLGIDFADESAVIRDQGDPSTAMASEMTQYSGNFGLGVFAVYKDYYLGASIPNLLPNEIGFNPTSSVVAEEVPHIYAMAGGIFQLNDKIRIRPALLGKYVNGAPFDLDVNVSLIFEKDASVGISYRAGGTGAGESIDLILYYQLSPKIGVGLAYDFSISKLAKYQTGSYEALVRYDLTSGREDLSNPRFF